MIDQSYRNYVNSKNIEELKAMIERMNKERFPEHLKFIQARIGLLKQENISNMNNHNSTNNVDNRSNSKNICFEPTHKNNHLEVESYETKQYKKVRTKLIFYFVYYFLSIILILSFMKNYLQDFTSIFIISIISILILKSLISISLISFLRKRTEKLKNRILNYLIILICLDLSYFIVLFINNGFNFKLLTDCITNLGFLINFPFYFYLNTSEQLKKYFVSYVV